MNKIVLGLMFIFAVMLVPRKSISKTDTDVIVLTSKNTVVLDSEIDGQSTSKIIAKAKELDSAMNANRNLFKKQAPIYLFINSPGGEIQSGLEMYEDLHGLGRQINTITLFAASMAFNLVQNLDDRLVLKNGVLMAHHATGQFEGAFGGIRPGQVDSRYQLWLDRIREMDEQTVSRTHGRQTYDSYVKSYDHEMWLTGTKAVNEGYADRIVNVKCDNTLSGTTTHHINFLGVDIQYEMDKCPLNTSPQNVQAASLDGKIINKELESKIKEDFINQFENKQNQIKPLMF